jgi:hypothetical protein
MNYINEIRHLRFLAEDARSSALRRNKVVQHMLDSNFELLNLMSWLNVCRSEASADYRTAVEKEVDIAYDTLKVLQNYDNDHRTMTNALRDLAYLLIKYKSEVQKEYRPPEAEEPAWMKDA